MIKNSENGRSMLEMMGVLAVIGVLSVGGLNMMTKMSNSRKVNAVMDEVGGLVTKARGIVREYDPSLDGNNFAKYLYNSKAYPSELEWCGDNCDYFLGTDDVSYTIQYTHSSSDKSLFKVEIDGLTTEMCMAVVTNNWGSVATNGFMKMTSGTTTSDTAMGIGTASNVCEDDSSVTLFFR